MNQPTLFSPTEPPSDPPPPSPTRQAAEEAPPAENTRDEAPRPRQPEGKRKGYQISARPADDPEDPETCTYTEALDEAGALVRAREEFPPAEGWIEHEAREIPGAC